MSNSRIHASNVDISLLNEQYSTVCSIFGQLSDNKTFTERENKPLKHTDQDIDNLDGLIDLLGALLNNAVEES